MKSQSVVVTATQCRLPRYATLGRDPTWAAENTDLQNSQPNLRGSQRFCKSEVRVAFSFNPHARPRSDPPLEISAILTRGTHVKRPLWSSLTGAVNLFQSDRDSSAELRGTRLDGLRGRSRTRKWDRCELLLDFRWFGEKCIRIIPHQDLGPAIQWIAVSGM